MPSGSSVIALGALAVVGGSLFVLRPWVSDRARGEELILEGTALERAASREHGFYSAPANDARREAIELYSEATRLCPECVDAYLRRSSARFVTGDPLG